MLQASINLVLVLFLSAASYSVLGAPFGQNSQIIPTEAAEGVENVLLPNISPSSMQLAPPFMQGAVPETQDSNTSNTISPALSDTVTNNSKWTSISGTWQPSTTGVQAGEAAKNTQGIAVRPVPFASPNLDISTSFTINKLHPNTASYVSIVYSWVDQHNYKYSGIMSYNNQTYVYFSTVSNGVLSVDPPSFPYLGPINDLDINPGDPVRMTLSLRENLETLRVNGFETEKESVDSNATAYVGLSYFRVGNILFHQFDVKQNTD